MGVVVLVVFAWAIALCCRQSDSADIPMTKLVNEQRPNLAVQEYVWTLVMNSHM